MLKYSINKRKNGNIEMYVVCCDGLDKYIANSGCSNRRFMAGTYRGSGHILTASILIGLFYFNNLVFSRLGEDFEEFNIKPMCVPVVSSTALKNNNIKLSGHESFDSLYTVANKVGTENVDFYFGFRSLDDAEKARDIISNLINAIINAIINDC